MIKEEQEGSHAALGVVEAFFAAKERHLDATMALFSDDAVNHFSCFPGAGSAYRLVRPRKVATQSRGK
jgi:hypothetical protein